MFTKSMLSAAVVFGLAFASAASAFDVEYRVMYSTPSEEPELQYGDILLNGAVKPRPSWACGMRIYDPKSIAWLVDGTKTSKPLSATIDILVSYAGCPQQGGAPSEQGILIKQHDGDTKYPIKLGADSALIRVALPTGRWIDRFGVARGCNCTLPNLPIRNSLPVWHATPVLLDALKAQIVDPRQQTRSAATAQTRQATIDALAADLASQIAARRRTNLGDLETSVRALEDVATDKLADASLQLAIASRYADAGMYADAYVAADKAGDAFDIADAFAGDVQFQIDNAAGE